MSNDAPDPTPARSKLDQWLVAYTRLAIKHPWRVMLVAIAILGTTWGITISTLGIRSDFVRLLPSESETAQRFRAAMERKRGGRSNLLILVQSPDEAANKRAIDALEAKVKQIPDNLVSSVEHGPGEEIDFYKKYRWLFASRRDLMLAECELRTEREKNSLGYLGLDDPCETQVDDELKLELKKTGRDLSLDEPDLRSFGRDKSKPKPAARASASTSASAAAALSAAPSSSTTPSASAASAGSAQEPDEAPDDNVDESANEDSDEDGAAESGKKKKAKKRGKDEESGLKKLKNRLESEVSDAERFKDGYFKTDNGRTYMLRLKSPVKGMGEFSADELYEHVVKIVDGSNPKQYHPEMVIGLGGDIPTAIAERQALIENVSVVSTTAVLLILGVIVFFFRSPISLIHIGLSMFTGLGVALMTAGLSFTYLNVATSFLGSIIAGNGINDAIVYLGRYKERRRAGDTHEEALEDTAVTCRIGTWLASVGASGAYAALMITSFRGFSEFGLIGTTGMVTCWFATFGFLPASITILERNKDHGKASAAENIDPTDAEATLRTANPVSRFFAIIGFRFRWAILGLAVLLCIGAAWPLPSYLKDPWEYNFAKLRSKSAKEGGARKWSKKADTITQTRGSPDLILTDDPKEVLSIKKKLLARDQEVTGGKFIDRVVTVHDRLGGSPELVKKKLDAVELIREEIDESMPKLKGEDLETAKEWRPPDDLKALTPDDLPGLLREEFSEKDGTVGTSMYVHWGRGVSRSKGHNLLKIADILEEVKLENGEVVANASRATVFAEMIRSMERDGPLATGGAFLVVIFVALMVTRRFRAATAVVGSLLVGVLLTVGGAAWLGVRLNFLNFVALPLTFGIGVEYAINLYDRIRFAGGDVRAGIASAGGPVTVCSLTTIFGYGSLLFADNQALQSFGKYAVAGEIATLVTAILVMPAMLHVTAKRAKAS